MNHFKNRAVSLGIVMDPIASINPTKDTTLCLLEAAQRKGWQLYYFEPKDLYLYQGCAKGHARALKVSLNQTHWFELSEPKNIDLSELDVVLMRLDPPVDTEFLYLCHILAHAERAGTPVYNPPRSLLCVNEKILAQEFSDLGPPTIVGNSLDDLLNFLEIHHQVVVKPLNEMGGASVCRINRDDGDVLKTLKTMLCDGQKTIMMQKLIPNYSEGDKRILLIDGVAVPYGLNRIPRDGEFRANLAAGGKGVAVALNEHDSMVCNRIAPRLKELDLLFVGIDLVAGYLTEINITSPTCAREINEAYTLDIGMDVMNAIEKRIAHKVDER